MTPRTVIKRDGETWIEGLTRGGDFADDERTRDDDVDRRSDRP